VVLFFYTGSNNIFKPKAIVGQVATKPSSVSVTAKAEPVVKVEENHPYTGRTLHVIGTIENSSKLIYYFAVAQNAQIVSEVSSEELERMGYKLEPATSCSVKVIMGHWSSWVICDAPQVGVLPNKGIAPSSRESDIRTNIL
jgi:hypothetical protein